MTLVMHRKVLCMGICSVGARVIRAPTRLDNSSEIMKQRQSGEYSDFRVKGSGIACLGHLL